MDQMTMTDRVSQALKIFRMRRNKYFRDNNIDRMADDHRYRATDDPSILDGLEASPEEMLLEMMSRLDLARFSSAQNVKYALAGLSTEMVTHETNGILSWLSSSVRTLANQYPKDGSVRLLADSVKTLASNFHFLAGFKIGAGSGVTRGEEIQEAITHEFSQALSRNRLELEVTKAFRTTSFQIPRDVIKAVAINLVRNSLNWTDGPVKVRFDCEVVEYDSQGWNDDDVAVPVRCSEPVIIVDDNGPGLKPNQSESIFAAGVSGRKSSGIGLYLCRAGLEHHYSTIVADDERSPLGGARFKIGRPRILRPDLGSQPLAEPNLHHDLANALRAMTDLLVSGHHAEASSFVDAYETASGLSMRVKLRGDVSPEEADVLEALEELDVAIEEHAASRLTKKAINPGMDL